MATSTTGESDLIPNNPNFPKPSTMYTKSSGPIFGDEANASGVSWAAVIAGAAVAASLSLALLTLGTGLGFSSVSIWSGSGASGTSLGVATISWLILTQVIVSSAGGYLAGRLRTKWSGLHLDEVFFRDTAHGFLVWAVGLIATASLLASAASVLVSGAATVGSAVIGGAGIAASAAASSGSSRADSSMPDPVNYFVDTLFRRDKNSGASVGTNPPPLPAMDSNSSKDSMRAEVVRIILNGTAISQEDKAYLSLLISEQTGLTSEAAALRIDNLLAQMSAKKDQAKVAVETARKAAAKVSIWLFIGLLIGAFCASFAATVGGRQRDSTAI